MPFDDLMRILSFFPVEKLRCQPNDDDQNHEQANGKDLNDVRSRADRRYENRPRGGRLDSAGDLRSGVEASGSSNPRVGIDRTAIRLATGTDTKIEASRWVVVEFSGSPQVDRRSRITAQAQFPRPNPIGMVPTMGLCVAAVPHPWRCEREAKNHDR